MVTFGRRLASDPTQINWIYIMLILNELMKNSLQSIDGVTYMDNFDFEERYRDINECNPFYWHPLHLPEVCVKMFNKLIRSRVTSSIPVRVMKRREFTDTYPFGVFPSVPMYEADILDLANYNRYSQISPYEKMLHLMWKDAMRLPTVPKIATLPFLGPVALYHQPISKKSETMVKQVAKAYADAGYDFKPYSPQNNWTESPPKEESSEKRSSSVIGGRSCILRSPTRLPSMAIRGIYLQCQAKIKYGPQFPAALLFLAIAATMVKAGQGC
ncbi:uncharacterized protein ACR2FA_012922 [Aphomia sociella]